MHKGNAMQILEKKIKKMATKDFEIRALALENANAVSKRNLTF